MEPRQTQPVLGRARLTSLFAANDDLEPLVYPRDFFDTYWRGDLKNEVFVIMSFADEFTPVWESAIKPAIENDTEGKLFAHRVDATKLSGSIVTEILDGIAHARLVFAEVSVCTTGKWNGQRNANAMYELGIAHAIRPAQELVVVRNDHEEINFDVAGIKIQSYDKADLVGARQTFGSLLNDAVKQVDQVKHLKVSEACDSLDADCLTLMASVGKDDFFSTNSPKTMGEVMNQMAVGTKDAVRHLLSLGIVRFDANTALGAYAYHWTAFGKAVLRKLNIRHV